MTIIAWVTLQADNPPPGVASAIFRDIAAIMTPGNVPFVMQAGASEAVPPGDTVPSHP